MKKLSKLTALLLAAGFSGGHGTAAAVGDTFSRLGFTDANDIAMTCATVGSRISAA